MASFHRVGSLQDLLCHDNRLHTQIEVGHSHWRRSVISLALDDFITAAVCETKLTPSQDVQSSPPGKANHEGPRVCQGRFVTVLRDDRGDLHAFDSVCPPSQLCYCQVLRPINELYFFLSSRSATTLGARLPWVTLRRYPSVLRGAVSK